MKLSDKSIDNGKPFDWGRTSAEDVYKRQAYDAKAGACGSVIDLNAYPFNHTCAVSGGHMEDESAKLLGDFFKRLRKRTK